MSVAIFLIDHGPSDGQVEALGGVMGGEWWWRLVKKWMNWRHDDIEVRHRDESCSGELKCVVWDNPVL